MGIFDVGIDLGTSNTRIYSKSKGMLLDQPSVVAMESFSNKLMAVGEEARQMLGRTPENIVAIRPLKDGVIADFDVTQVMLKYFINKALEKSGFSRTVRTDQRHDLALVHLKGDALQCADHTVIHV